jgi:uncharacterized protein (TIGR02001 family)
MQKTRIIVGAGALCVALAGPAFAEEGEWQASYNAGVASDYVFRGVSQTEEDPAFQAGADITKGRFYAGVWGSNVSYAGDPDTNAEIDLYAGFRPTIGPYTLDIGAIGYMYTNQPDGADYSYVEGKLGISRTFNDETNPTTTGLTLFLSPDFFGAAEDEAAYLVGDVGYQVNDRLTLSAQLGRRWVSSDLDYTHWNFGAAGKVYGPLSVDLRYHDTDEHDFGSAFEERLVATLKATF